jgi:hypothetical protein
MAISGGAEPARQTFGSYEILETLGQGGMGVVYRAIDLTLGRPVALKVLRDDLRYEPQVVTRFQREAQAVASLSHPNIVQIYSVGTVDRIPYLAMEFVEGTPLSMILQRERCLPWERSLALAEQVAEALASAHDAQVIHRDIKPANILIGDRDHAYVTDFGIAKILTAEIQLTIDGSRLGTPQYMAPERCQNGTVTAASDLYSLGVLLFQMISGRLPYNAPTPVDLVKKIVGESPVRLRQVKPDIPEDVERLVAWMIEKNPKDRPADARMLAKAIARVRAGKPLDENQSHLAGALAAFRAVSAPAMHASLTEQAKTLRRHALAALWGRMAPKLRRVFRPARVGAVFCITALLAATIWAVEPWLRSRTAATGPASSAGHELTRWNQPGTVADFMEEAPGVLLVQLNLPHFVCGAMVWTTADSGVVVQLDRSGPASRRSRAFGVLQPKSTRAQLFVPPEMAWGMDSPSSTGLLGTCVRPNGPLRRDEYLFLRYCAGELLPRPVGEVIHVYDMASVTAGATASTPVEIYLLEGVKALNVGAMALAPNGHTVAMALSAAGHDGDWFLAEQNLATSTTAGAWTALTPPGAPIAAIVYSPDGGQIAYLRRNASSRDELRVLGPNRGQEGSWLAQGNLALEPGAFSPDGQYLLLGETSHGNPRQFRIMRVSDGQPRMELGPTEAAAWHPRGTYVVVVAPDRKNQNQLWAVSMQPPHHRAQLTFLDTGLASACSVAPDGVLAASVLRGTSFPSLVFVDLSLVAF